MFKQIIADKEGTPVEVNTDAGEDTGLVVATRPHKSFVRRIAFFTHPDYGREMAQDGLFGGAMLLFHDGTDTVAWTFSQPVGAKWTEDVTDQFYAGTKSLECDNPVVNDVMQVINNVGPGDDIDVVDSTINYVALSMRIRVDTDWLAGDSFSIYAHLDGQPVGNKVRLEDYFPYAVHDRWHYINIPLEDMGLEAASLDAFRIENEAREGAKSPKFWIDDWGMEEMGAPIAYTVIPDVGTWFHITSYQFVFVDAYNADNEDSTVPHLSYEKILGMTPTVGFKYEEYMEEDLDPLFSMRIASLMDLLSLPHAQLINCMSDGTNTLITVSVGHPEEDVLKAENLDKLVITLEDDFSQLLYFRVSVQGLVEQRK